MKISVTLTLKIGRDHHGPAEPEPPATVDGPGSASERSEVETEDRPQYGVGFGRPLYTEDE